MGKRHIAIIGLCFIALGLPIFVRNVLLMNILIICYYYAYLALCWNLVGGYSGVLSLGHGIFYGIGAYTSAAFFALLGVTPWVGMFCGATLAAISGFLIGRVSFAFELKGFFFIVVGLALTQICGDVVKQIELLGATEGMTLPLKMGWDNIQFSSKEEYYFIILFMLFIAILISFLIERSKMGYNLMAIREDEDTAEASGVDTKGTKVLILTLSAFLTALGGSFYVQYVFFVDAESAFSTGLNINLILAVVIGGIGTIAGPILGAFFFVLVSELVRFLPMQSQVAAAVTRMIFALALMIVMIYFPRGIFRLGVGPGILKGILRRVS